MAKAKAKTDGKVRIVEVTSCKGYPYIYHSDGGGFIEPYIQCSQTSVILKDENIYFDISKIHSKCPLKFK